MSAVRTAEPGFAAGDSASAGVAAARRRQRLRLAAQSAFFVLFVLAPVFDLFRLDLELGHFILLGMDWTLGLDDFRAGRIGAGEAAVNLVLRGFVPIALAAATLILVAWRWGRLYCGWLCPHFSVVETVNRVMRRAIGRLSLWDRAPLPERDPDGTLVRADSRWWLAVVPLAAGFAFVWAVVLLTYLLPPAEVYGNLWRGEPTRNQAIFLTAATAVLFVEFMIARHLFCRFGCAVGLFQSLAWMGNRDAMVMGYRRDRAAACAACDAACDNACPMRLKPRDIKRHMFACTQCGQCSAACAQVQAHDRQGPLLDWVNGPAALDKTQRERRRRHVRPSGGPGQGG